MADVELNIDALLPQQMAVKAEGMGIKKANLDFWTMFALAVLAGAFIAVGALFATTAVAGAGDKLTYGEIRILSGLVFCVGLILVVVAGAELFTGNNLIVMAWAARKVSTLMLLRNWVIVYAGNLAGALLTVVIMLFCKQYTFGNGAVGATALNTASTKVGYDFIQAVALGVMCNALVCLAVWLCYSARSTTDRILSIIFPITTFVAAGFEHSVANMYFIPIGLLIKQMASPDFWAKIGKTAADYGNLTWGHFFLNNLLPVTIGNIIGGSLMVGLVYWFVYQRSKTGTVKAGEPAPAPPRGGQIIAEK